jgi:hypothetical protein
VSYLVILLCLNWEDVGRIRHSNEPGIADVFCRRSDGTSACCCTILSPASYDIVVLVLVSMALSSISSLPCAVDATTVVILSLSSAWLAECHCR